MKQILYRHVVSIDGHEYTVHSCDYSESIKELIQDKLLEDNNQEIIDHIIDDQ
jgi:hypothetical protein|tara:strand:- start:232 stop:390 length:159 start_codon:yes stop_codon:yes gene_type:complete